MEDSFSVIFFESYFDAILSIESYKDRSDLLEAIYNYLKSGKELKLTGQAMTCFIMMKPILDANKRNIKKRGNPNFKKGKSNPYYKTDELSSELSNNYPPESKISLARNFDNNDKKDNYYASSNSNNNSTSNSISNSIQIEQSNNISIVNAENDGESDECNVENSDKTAIINDNSVEKLKNVLKSDENKENLKDVERRLVSEMTNYKLVASKNAKSIKEVGPAKVDAEKTYFMRDKMPPTLEDVKKYIEDYNLVVDAKVFYDYYEARNWMVGSKPMFSYRAMLRGWQKNAEEIERRRDRARQYGTRLYTQEELDQLFDNLDDIEV